MKKYQIFLITLFICSYSQLHGAFVKDGQAFILSERSLYVFDVKNPLEPTLLGNIKLDFPAEDLVVIGKIAYVADGKGGLCLIDASQPARLRLLSQVKTDFARAVKVDGSYAYIADRGSGLTVVEVKNTKKPRIVGNCKTPGFAWDVAVKPGLAAVADCEFGLRFIDISNPGNPVEIGHWDVYDQTGIPQQMHWALGVCLSGNRALGAFTRGGMKIIDISDPANPKFLGQANLGFTQAQEVEVQSNTAFVMVFGNISAVDISDPVKPIVIGSFRTDSPALNIFPWNGYLFSRAGVLDVHDVSRMRMVSLFEGLILREKQTASY
jgi:hypothetical protein